MILVCLTRTASLLDNRMGSRDRNDDSFEFLLEFSSINEFASYRRNNRDYLSSGQVACVPGELPESYRADGNVLLFNWIEFYRSELAAAAICSAR